MTKFFIKLSLSLSCKTLKVSINYFYKWLLVMGVCGVRVPCVCQDEESGCSNCKDYSTAGACRGQICRPRHVQITHDPIARTLS